MDGSAASDPGSRDERRASRFDRGRRGAAGKANGTSGAGAGGLLRAYLAVAVVVLAFDCVNVLSALHDAARSGRPLVVWKLITGELSSGVGDMVACGLVYLALRWAPPGRAAWTRVVLVHGPATIVFSAIHVAVMMLSRIPVFLAMGVRYHPPVPGDLLYEYRKDVLGYGIMALIFWLFCRPGDSPISAPVRSTLAGADASFDIVEGARTLRRPVRQILAVRAAGNYVEFLLEDGRRPLMRTSLGEMEATLAPHGLIRTHRSWLVNPARLRSLEAVGSGDYRLELDGGADAPLSRRFPAALERLRGVGS